MIIVYDNFLDNPNEVRSLSLSKEFKKRDVVPGYRSLDIHPRLREEIVFKIKHLTNNQHLYCEEGDIAYQYIPEYYKCGSYHSDSPYIYTCILYLTPEPEDNSGTEVCDDDIFEEQVAQNVWDRWVVTKKQFLKDQSNPEEYDIMLSEQCNYYSSHSIVVKNKFNRMVIFDSHLLHRAQSFFGKDINDSRLTIVSFISED